MPISIEVLIFNVLKALKENKYQMFYIRIYQLNIEKLPSLLIILRKNAGLKSYICI